MISDSLKRDIMGSVFFCLFVCRDGIELRLSYALKRAKTSVPGLLAKTKILLKLNLYFFFLEGLLDLK